MYHTCTWPNIKDNIRNLHVPQCGHEHKHLMTRPPVYQCIIIWNRNLIGRQVSKQEKTTTWGSWCRRLKTYRALKHYINASMWLSVLVDMQWTRNSDTSRKTRQKIPKGTQATLSCANRPTPHLIFQWHQWTLQSSGLWSKPHVKSIIPTDHKNSHNHQTLGTQEAWIDWLFLW